MQFWTQRTLSFKMMYDATCYPSGMGTCHFWWPLLQHYIERKQNSEKNLTSVKGHNSITKLKMMCNNPNLDLVNIYAYTKFGIFLSIWSQDIELKQNYDRITEWRNPNPV